MGIEKTRWAISVDDLTVLIDAEIEARLAPFTDGNRSARVRFLYKMAKQILCSTPETLAAVVEAIQRLTRINSSYAVIEFPAAFPEKAGNNEGPERKSRTGPVRIDGFMGHEKAYAPATYISPATWTKDWAASATGRPTYV